MKSLLVAALLMLCAGCRRPGPPGGEMGRHLSQISPSPPPAVEYTKSINAYRVDGPVPWEKIPASRVATTILSDAMRAAGMGTPLTVQAAWDATTIFLRVSWPDPAAHIDAGWDEAEKLAFNWNIRSESFAAQGCGPACHFYPKKHATPGKVRGMWLPEKEGLVDNWVWMAHPKNVSLARHRNLTGTPRVMKEREESQEEHLMRSGYREDPDPSTLKAEARYGQGRWTVVWRRRLKTPNPKEAQFDPEREPSVNFGMSVFPGTELHHYSGLLTLTFVRGAVF